MQVFRDLYVRGEPDQLAAAMGAIAAAVTGDWARNTEAEERMRELALRNEGDTYCFSCLRRAGRPSATVFLSPKDERTYYVPNIVPREQRELSRAEYNHILEDFFTRFVRTAAAGTGASAELTEPDADLQRWVSPETVKKLQRFSRTANKATGSSHPSDRDRWYDFIIAAHRDGARLEAGTLARWLQEVESWDEEQAYKLAVEYEFAQELLAHTEGRRVGAGV
ncbi:MAG: hypothetical protein K2X82_24580 [Gemmataceae bacterium]|nr:hypothetical protein [Gemmataceae bacterium]